MELEVITKGGVVLIPVRLQPKAKSCGIVGVHDRRLKVLVTAPPVDDAANIALCELIAKALGVRKSSVRIASGNKNRSKTLAIEDLAPEDILERLSRFFETN